MATEKNELETIFVDCIEEVRKDIMKRKLKQEIMSKRKFKPLETENEEAKEFEESLLRLAQLAKGKIKLVDFTPHDKVSLLDLFVNNEKTLLAIYEALFPHRNMNLEGASHNSTYRINSYQALHNTSDGNEYGGMINENSFITSDNKASRNLTLLDPIASAPVSF